MIRWLLPILCALSACGMSEAARYQAALHAPDFEEAARHCERLSSVNSKGDCLVASMERHNRLNEADCERVPAGLWREECLFLYAERAAAAGDLQAAFATCDRINFGRECSFHLIREAARAVRDVPIDQAGAAIAPYRTLDRAPDAPRLFWKAWFRERQEVNIPVDPTGCPDLDCEWGAMQPVFMLLNTRVRDDAAKLCSAPITGVEPDGRVLWADTPLTRAWVSGWQNAECRRRGWPLDDAAP